MSALHDAVAANDTAAVAEALKTDKAMLNSYGPNGELLLHKAIVSKNLAVARALLEAGANVNQGSEERGTTKGYTAAHFATRAGDVDALELLREFKADFNRQAADGWAPIHVACFSGKSAAMRKLVELGADPNLKNEHGMSPLVFAANHGRVADVRFLIKRGGDVNFVDANGDCLMHHALHFRLQEMFEGEYDMPECQWDVVVCLAVNGAPVLRPNNSGKSPIEWIKECEMPALEDVLKIVSHNAETIRQKGGEELNYVTLLTAPAQVFEALGLSKAHAADLERAVRKFDEQRLAEKKRREESRPAGGCPVMKGGRKKKGAADNANAATPAGHPDVDMSKVPEGTDPSNGQCPFFAKKAKQEANSASTAAAAPPTPAPAAAAAPSPPVAAPASTVPLAPAAPAQKGGAPALTWETVYENRTVILLMLLSFFVGTFVEQKLNAWAPRA